MNNRKLFILWFICLALIAAAVSARISDSAQEIPNEPHESPLEKPSPRLSAESSFFETDKPVATVDPSPTSVPEIVSAKSYLVGNIQTGEIYMKKNVSLVLPVASMSKLVTAIAALDMLPDNSLVEITGDNLKVPSDAGLLREGERYGLDEILYPLLLSSSNAAAEALASTSRRASFLEQMSAYAWEIGMDSTYFADPSGLDSKNISTAADFFALARYLVGSHPEILALTRLKSVSLGTTTEHGAGIFRNIHPFAGTPDFIGGKTGHTLAAKDTMLSIFEIQENPIAIIVIGSEDRRSDTAVLLKRAREIMKARSE